MDELSFFPFVFNKMYDWLLEKHQAASEEITDLSNIRGKYQRHQAFEAELAASKDKLDQIKEVDILADFVCQIFYISTQIFLHTAHQPIADAINRRRLSGIIGLNQFV